MTRSPYLKDIDGFRQRFPWKLVVSALLMLVGFPVAVAVFGTLIGLIGGPLVVLAALAAAGWLAVRWPFFWKGKGR